MLTKNDAAAEASTPEQHLNTFQDVPLGGQPTRPHISYEGMQETTKVEHEACDKIWEALIKALDKALEACPPGRSKGAMEVRNHCHVWKVQAQSLKDAL